MKPLSLIFHIISCSKSMSACRIKYHVIVSHMLHVVRCYLLHDRYVSSASAFLCYIVWKTHGMHAAYWWYDVIRFDSRDRVFFFITESPKSHFWAHSQSHSWLAVAVWHGFSGHCVCWVDRKCAEGPLWRPKTHVPRVPHELWHLLTWPWWWWLPYANCRLFWWQDNNLTKWFGIKRTICFEEKVGALDGWCDKSGVGIINGIWGFSCPYGKRTVDFRIRRALSFQRCQQQWQCTNHDRNFWFRTHNPCQWQWQWASFSREPGNARSPARAGLCLGNFTLSKLVLLWWGRFCFFCVTWDLSLLEPFAASTLHSIFWNLKCVAFSAQSLTLGKW